MSYEIWTPALVFSGNNSEAKLREAKVKASEMANNFVNVALCLMENAGLPNVFKEGISWLIGYCADVEDATKRLIDAKLDEATVRFAISTYDANIRVIQGRLSRLGSNISRKEKELEVVPAFTTCQGILALFRDPKYPFWSKPEITSPLLVSFAGIYLSVGVMTVALIKTYREDVEKEMALLGNVVDDYRRRFLCFRLEGLKYSLLMRNPLLTRKNLVDKYDSDNRTTARKTAIEDFECSCLYEQAYSILLAKVYGNFFDSVKAAILESKLLPPGVVPKNEWCTKMKHHRCYSILKVQSKCFCKRWDPREELFLSVKESYLQKVIETNQCLSTVSSSDSFVRHYQYICRTCGIGENGNESICRRCILTCHKGHNVEFLEFGWFYCYCAESKCSSQQTEADIVAKNEEPWPGIICDGCDASVVGERYKCKNCYDYDLCERCITALVHTSHSFVQLVHTADGIQSLDANRFKFCVKCETEPLCGSFFECRQCENYSLCRSCHDGHFVTHKHDLILSNPNNDSVIDDKIETEAVDDVRIERAIFERNPTVPFAKTFELGENTFSYVININGRTPPNPYRFVININLKEKVVLHFNPRWDENRIVLNTKDDVWDVEKSVAFRTLFAEREFNIKIVLTNIGYDITVNDESPTYFPHRIMYLSTELQLELRGDVIPKLVTCDLYNHS